MIPAPNMKDVIMDLQADSEQFLHGKAHKGMAFGARNILVTIYLMKKLTCKLFSSTVLSKNKLLSWLTRFQTLQKWKYHFSENGTHRTASIDRLIGKNIPTLSWKLDFGQIQFSNVRFSGNYCRTSFVWQLLNVLLKYLDFRPWLEYQMKKSGFEWQYHKLSLGE